jgi:hypothetical protein
LRFGLRRDARAPVNTIAFQEFRNLRPTTKWGAKNFHPISAPVSDANITSLGETKAWPFPQLYKGTQTRHLFFEDTVYPVSNPYAAASAMTWFNGHAFGASSPGSATVAAGGAWQFWSFNNTVFAANGDTVLMMSPFGNYAFGLDSESLTNGPFTGSASSWTLGGGWAYGTNNIVHTPSGTPSTAQQLFADQVAGKQLIVGREYEVTVVVANRTAGTVTLPDGVPISADGTYTRRFVAGLQALQMVASTAFDGSIESVTCRKTSPRIATGCNWNDGRAVFAGFSPDNMFNIADWTTYLATFDDNIPDEFISLMTSNGAPSNAIWFSSFGAQDIYWLFSLDLYKYGSMDATPETNFTDARTYLRHLWKRNESALMMCPWKGDVYATKQLGDMVVAYGGTNSNNEQGGVVGFRDYGGKIGQVNPQNYSADLGLINRMAMAGDEARHVFVTQDGNLWHARMDGGLVLEELEGREFIASLDPSDLMVTFEPHRREFYIGDGSDAMLISETGGLCKPPWMPTTVYVSGGASQGITFEPDEPTAVLLATMPFDARAFGGIAGDIFSLHRTRIITTDIGTGGDRWSATVYYRTKNSLTWTIINPQPFEDRGVAQHGGIPAVEAFIVLIHGDRTETNGLDGLYVEGSMDGIYSTEHWMEAATPAAATIP